METQNDKPMKTTGKFLVAVLGAALLMAGCGKKQAKSSSSWSLDKSGASAQLKQFVAAQETQSRALAKQDGNKLPSDFDTFYKAAETGDWQDATNLFEQMSKSVRNDSSLRGSWWSATMDAYGVFEMFPPGDKYATAFGNDIIQSIPDGSIYFGGTDPGRFVVTALTESHADGKPFFVLSQNPMADGTYLKYLRSMYAGKIYTPTDEDSQKCFQDYTEDVTRRRQNNQLKPGEDVRTDSNGKVQISGHIAVMEINALLVKTIFDKNPDREFYIEESFPLDWMYPNLEPHGLIMKINRQPLPTLSGEIVKQDRDYWTKYLTPMIGGWLNKDTTVEEVAAFVEKTYVKNDLSGFTGDSQFVQNSDAQKMFSKLRSSIAGVYVWWMKHATDASEKQRMADAADFAFRQAFALCPYSPEVVFRYIDFLMGQNRGADALLVVETAVKMPLMQGEGGQMRVLAKQLERYRKTK
jgi:hypothetical protein